MIYKCSCGAEFATEKQFHAHTGPLRFKGEKGHSFDGLFQDGEKIADKPSEAARMIAMLKREAEVKPAPEEKPAPEVKPSLEEVPPPDPPPEVKPLLDEIIHTEGVTPPAGVAQDEATLVLEERGMRLTVYITPTTMVLYSALRAEGLIPSGMEFGYFLDFCVKEAARLRFGRMIGLGVISEEDEQLRVVKEI